MAREVQIDEDTLVGYNYKEQLYYITNKDTTTTRTTPLEVYNILQIIAPDRTELTTEEAIEELCTAIEYLSNVYYTWEDTGAYIKTVQFNTYAENPLTLDLEAKKIYIMNSDLIYDLTLNEATSYRLPYLIDYYKDILGLTILYDQMEAVYNKLLSYYTPNFYIEIQSRPSTDKDLFYSNIIKLSNYNDKAPLSYTLTYNPNDVYTGHTIADITHINPSTRTIQLRSTIPSSLQVEDKVRIADSTIGEATSDGMYTIQGIDTEARIIQLAEYVPNSYEVQYLPCYKVIAKTTISSINRDNFTITLSSDVPNTIKVGDKIFLKGTTQAIEGETVTADGEYTVANISGRTIVVSEQLSINYTGSTAYIYKQVRIGYIQSIIGLNIQLYNAPTVSIQANDFITVWNAIYKVNSTGGAVITLVDGSNIQGYTQPFAHLQVPIQQPYVNVEIENSTLTNIPNGSFMVDTYQQAQGYISLITPDLPLPAFESSLSNRVTMQGAINVPLPSGSDMEGECLGLYHEIYSDQ